MHGKSGRQAQEEPGTLKPDNLSPDRFPFRAVQPKFRRIAAGSVLMIVGVVSAYFVSYWTYYQGVLCTEVCAPGPRIGIPDFSIELTALLAGMALVPLGAALDFRWVWRYFGRASALTVAFVALANLVVPLSFLLKTNAISNSFVLEVGPLPWIAPPLTLLLVAAGCAVSVSALGSAERVGLRTEFVRGLAVSVTFVVAVFWPLAMSAINRSVPFYLESGIFIALFYAIPGVIILSLALVSLTPGVPPFEPTTG